MLKVAIICHLNAFTFFRESVDSVDGQCLLGVVKRSKSRAGGRVVGFTPSLKPPSEGLVNQSQMKEESSL